MAEPIVRVYRVVEVVEPDFLVADEEVIAYHNAHKRSEEDRERAENRNEGRCLVDQLPRLDNPRCRKSDDSPTADVDAPREDTSEVNFTSDCITTDVLEEDGKRRG